MTMDASVFMAFWAMLMMCLGGALVAMGMVGFGFLIYRLLAKAIYGDVVSKAQTTRELEAVENSKP